MSGSEPGYSLASAIDRVKVAAESAMSSATDPDAVMRLHRLSTDASVVQRLRQRCTSSLRPRDLALAAIDAEHVARILENLSEECFREEDLERAMLLSDRIMRSVGYLAIEPAPAPSRPHSVERNDEPTTVEDQSRQVLSGLVSEYRTDAARERAGMKWLYAAALLSLLLGVAIALYGISAAHGRTTFEFAEFGAYGLVALVMLACGVMAGRRAAKYRQAAQEATRLERQFSGLDAYLSPMPPALRDLVRGTMVQRLFPGLPEGDEPWREPKWPDTDAILKAIRDE